MAKCWTCGTHVSGYRYTCSSCESLNEIKNLRKTVKSYGKNLDYIAQIQQEGFEALKDTLSSGLSEIASAIEWGLGEISWQLQQQTDVLRSIDHTLKTPSETQANEWRLHAEELRRRGVLEESEEFFLKSLNEYRLDYRIYVGLAETYLQMNKFDKAKVFLEKSLPHAPDEVKKELAAWCADCQNWVWVKSDACTQCHGSRLSKQYFVPTGFDWRSYSYRLIGHIYACEENYQQASSALYSSRELSPNYVEGVYDFVQYCARLESISEWTRNERLSELEWVILSEPFYFYLAQHERNFDLVRPEVEKLLTRLSTEASRKAKDAIAKSESALKEAHEAVSTAKQALSISRDKSTLNSNTMIENAEAKLKLAKDKVASGDYAGFLEAILIAGESYSIANNAVNAAYGEREHFQKRRAEKVENAWKRVPGALIGWPWLSAIIGVIGGGIIGSIIGIFVPWKGTTDAGAIAGFLIGIVISFIVGIDNIRKELQ